MSDDSHLDKLIRDAVRRGMVGNFSRQAENFGEQLAKQIWADESFRQQIQAIMRRFGQQALEQLSGENGGMEAALARIDARLTAIEQQLTGKS
jgi:hypothetical protein